jgi:hypothetical protein
VLSTFQAGASPDLPAVLSALAQLERRSGMMVLFSDGLYGRAGLLEALRRLRHRGHEVIFFQIWDPAELDPPVRPGMAFRDPESEVSYEPLPHGEDRP